MANWLFKTEPDDYSVADLERDGRTPWDGVTKVTSDPYPDPDKDDLEFENFGLVRFSRLAVKEVPSPLWGRLIKMAEDAD
jgi:predicted RNA-binding protein with PUA-like domain